MNATFPAADILPQFNTELSPTGRFLIGSSPSIEQISWQVSVQVLNTHICGGSIVANFWILTAAHCALYPNTWYTVRSGSLFTDQGGLVTSVAFALTHEGYDVDWHGIPVHDITIIRVRTPFTFDGTTSPIPMFNPREEAVEGSTSLITGWGLTSEGGNASPALLAASVPIVSSAECNSNYIEWGGIRQSQICAAPSEGGSVVCNSDSGSPLAIDGRLAGIKSWGNGCARPGSPGVYTEVSSYVEWITLNTGI